MADKATPGRILIIDDQEPTRYVFRRILTHAGFEVEEAGTGEQGLLMALSIPDLIISDVNLPDMLGYDVCRRLRANPLTVSIPILQISASFISDESKVQALGRGADSYLTQPVEPTVLVAQVKALLRLRRAEAHSSLSARQWQTTFDALSDGLALIGSDGLIVRVSKTILEMLNLVPSDTEGHPVAEIFESRFDISSREFHVAGQKHGVVELSSRGRWFRVRIDAIESDPNEEAGSILLLADITDHKKLQETLKLSERLAATGRLAHVIAHEINNPLEAMTNLLYLTQQSLSTEQQLDGYVSQAAAELMRISHITKQVLAYHRESKDPIITDPSDLIDGILAMFLTHASRKGIDVRKSVRCTRSLSIHPGEIRQVFSNLISNGLDAMGEQGEHSALSASMAPIHEINGKGFTFYSATLAVEFFQRSCRKFSRLFTLRKISEVRASDCGSVLKSLGSTAELFACGPVQPVFIEEPSSVSFFRSFIDKELRFITSFADRVEMIRGIPLGWHLPYGYSLSGKHGQSAQVLWHQIDVKHVSNLRNCSKTSRLSEWPGFHVSFFGGRFAEVRFAAIPDRRYRRTAGGLEAVTAIFRALPYDPSNRKEVDGGESPPGTGTHEILVSFGRKLQGQTNR